MDYEKYTDEELLLSYKDKDPGVVPYILNKYKNLVRGKSQNMFILGGDVEDLIQEGMIGLYEAIQDYDPGRDVKFLTFATVCVSRKIYSAIDKAKSSKHSPLNDYVSIYDDDFFEEPQGNSADPEEAFLNRERLLLIADAAEKSLSKLEKQVFELKIAGLDYVNIAKVLDMEPKAVDNALQRIKKKIKNILDKE